MTFINASGVTSTKKLNFLNFRGNNYVATFKSIPGTIGYSFKGSIRKYKVDSGLKSHKINDSDPDVIDLTLRGDGVKT